MELTNLNESLLKEATEKSWKKKSKKMGGRKSCSEYIFLKKSLKESWTVIILDSE